MKPLLLPCLNDEGHNITQSLTKSLKLDLSEHIEGQNDANVQNGATNIPSVPFDDLRKCLMTFGTK